MKRNPDIPDEKRRANADRYRKWVLANPQRRKQIALDYYYRHKRKNENWRLLAHYQLTLEQYEQIEREQGGVCAICGKPPHDKIKRGIVARLHCDHDHRTGRFRGLLCGNCNRALGMFEDEVACVRAALQYLEAHRS